MNAFTGYGLADGFSIGLDRAFPTTLTTFAGELLHEYYIGHTSYIYVHDGVAHLATAYGSWSLRAGFYASVPGSFKLWGGKGIVVTRENYKGLFAMGGPVEEQGRLKYIDGCTDTLLLSPPIKGDPCLNLLYFPPGIDQTEHIHPSDRIGLVMSGHGRCVHRPTPGAEPLFEDLLPGMAFCIHAGGHHKFQTPYGEAMRVVAYHPDSDHGPSDEEHPMLNRTIVDGVSARYIDDIRTK